MSPVIINVKFCHLKYLPGRGGLSGAVLGCLIELGSNTTFPS